MSGPFVKTTDDAQGDGGGIDSGNIALEDFSQQRNGTRLNTRAGYEFAPTNNDLPRITPEGVFVTQAQADEILAEAPDGLITSIKASELDEDEDEAPNGDVANPDDDVTFDNMEVQ